MAEALWRRASWVRGNGRDGVSSQSTTLGNAKETDGFLVWFGQVTTKLRARNSRGVCIVHLNASPDAAQMEESVWSEVCGKAKADKQL